MFIFPDKKDHCCSTHLIDGDGTFNVAGVDNFTKEVKLAECGLSYAVVAIMGPQSSGMYSQMELALSFFYLRVSYIHGLWHMTYGALHL